MLRITYDRNRDPRAHMVIRSDRKQDTDRYRLDMLLFERKKALIYVAFTAYLRRLTEAIYT